MKEPMMKNPYTYVFETEVPYYQCDVQGKMKLSWLLKVMERAAGDHLTHLGLPYETLYQEGIVFLLSKAGVRLYRCPTAADVLRVETAPQSVRGAQYNRQIQVFAEADGELLAEIHTVWFMADPVERKILRPDKFTHKLETVPPEEAMEPFGGARFRVTGEEQESRDFTVQYSHLDVNGHLNNTVYGDLVTDLLPFEEFLSRGLKEFRIVYRHEVRHGETIHMKLFHDAEEDTWYITGQRDEGPCFEAMVKLGTPVK